MSTQEAALPLDPTQRWVVQVTFGTRHEVPEKALVHMDEEAERLHDATVAARAEAPGLVFTAEVDGNQVAAVPSWTSRIAEDVAGYGVAADIWLVELQVSTPEQYEAASLRPDVPELAGVTEAAELLGVSRQRLAVLRQRAGFPAALVELAQGPVWAVSALRTYDTDRNREPGRPRLQNADAL